jgi:hypothetical protein
VAIEEILAILNLKTRLLYSQIWRNYKYESRKILKHTFIVLAIEAILAFLILKVFSSIYSQIWRLSKY